MGTRLNPLTIWRLDLREEGRVLRLRSFARGRSLLAVEFFEKDDRACFDAMLGWMQGGAPPAHPADPATIARWLASGLLVTEAEWSPLHEQATPELGDGMKLAARLMPSLAPLVEAEPICDLSWPESLAELRHQAFVEVPPILQSENLNLVRDWYGLLHDDEWSRFEQGREGRRGIHGDPVGVAIMRELCPRISELFEQDLQPSYAFAVQYHGGNDLPPHTDREQCEITVSLLIEHFSDEPREPAAWPIILHPGTTGELRIEQPVAGGVAFKGREMEHARLPLPAGETARYLFLHYVDADFAGPLD
ncbi:hypothetical protein [Erythrobacter litoralis]|uniref:Uncharacterized protein n=1 Tax=Erythrobacter litoralis (strain HTCC2594) TaxID=314225 RepID=Q2N8T0_ERYLH|nr:hypothetical protein [Erythrobacter litoralis]ABC63911.1 hypothetical protein ELI_09095 [Erythrobacter litoralis HTCC2594]